MKLKYKILTGALAASMLLPASAFGGVVDYALYTDIVAEINGHPIRSYNINGHTAVVAEDLRGYGFWALWNPAERTLSVTRAVKDGTPETPANWPEYTPEHKVGERAKPVYSTDIVTYVAGEKVSGSNIGGETIIWMESLKPFGTLVWNPDARKAEFTLFDNPVGDKIAELKKNVDDWKEIGGAGSTFETIPSQLGTLVISTMTGTPHGTSRNMIFVKNDGTTVDILSLLPMSGFGPSFYANPRDIEIDEVTGSIITFVTPVYEGLEDGTVREWGDTLCKVDITSGKLISAQPLKDPFETWSANTGSMDLERGDELYVKVKREGSKVFIAEGKLPKGLGAELTETGITIYNYVNELDENTSYGRAYKALSDLNLKSLTSEDYTRNTAKQLEEAGKYCQLINNGNPVSYDVYWSQGNGHRDLTFEFADPISLADGDDVNIVIKDIN